MLQLQYGVSLCPLSDGELEQRRKPIPLHCTRSAAWIVNDCKLVVPDIRKQEYDIYHMATDRREAANLFALQPDLATRMLSAFQSWNSSVQDSPGGGRITPRDGFHRTFPGRGNG